jgi:hypothetical protein
MSAQGMYHSSYTLCACGVSVVHVVPVPFLTTHTYHKQYPAGQSKNVCHTSICIPWSINSAFLFVGHYYNPTINFTP